MDLTRDFRTDFIRDLVDSNGKDITVEIVEALQGTVADDEGFLHYTYNTFYFKGYVLNPDTNDKTGEIVMSAGDNADSVVEYVSEDETKESYLSRWDDLYVEQFTKENLLSDITNTLNKR